MKLQKVLSLAYVGAAGLVTSGCVTNQMNDSCMASKGVDVLVVGVNNTKFDTDCHRGRIARQMMTMDAPTAAAGLAIAEADDPKIGRGMQTTRDAIANKGAMQCTVSRVEGASSATVRCPVPVITVEQSVPAAGAPTPNP